MKIVLSNLGDREVFDMVSVYAPIGEWPIFGFSLREILEAKYGEVYYKLTDRLIEDIVIKRWGVRSASSIRGERIYISQNVYGSPLEIIDVIGSLPYKCKDANCVFYIGDKVFAIYTDEDIELDNLRSELEDFRKIGLGNVNLKIYRHPWELLKYFITNPLPDIDTVLSDLFGFEGYRGVYYGGSEYRIEDKHTIMNVDKGPIFIDEKVTIEGHSFLKGPLIIRSNTLISSAKIYGSVIGETCKIGGEVGDSIINGYTNSIHHSYIGHSLVGYWVNIGAGTVFSDLKNTYGLVRVKMQDKTFETGLIKFGSIVGDYVKISINSSIYSGSIIGHNSHVYGLVNRSIPPFKIFNRNGMGEMERMDLDKAIEIARRMYSRRGVEMIDEEVTLFKSLYEKRYVLDL